MTTRTAVTQTTVLRVYFTLSLLFAGLWVTTVRAEGYGPPEPRQSEQAATEGDSTILLGVENVFGYSSTTESTSYNDAFGDSVDSELDLSGVSLIGGGTDNPYAAPRFAIDFRLGPTFTLGGTLHFGSGTTSSSIPGAPGVDGPVTSTFSLHARVGLLLGSGSLKIWPRFGLASFSRSLEANDAEATVTGTAIALEVPFVIHSSNVGVSLGPALYVPTGGSFESTDAMGARTTGDTTVSGFGLNLGVLLLL